MRAADSPRARTPALKQRGQAFAAESTLLVGLLNGTLCHLHPHSPLLSGYQAGRSFVAVAKPPTLLLPMLAQVSLTTRNLTAAGRALHNSESAAKGSCQGCEQQQQRAAIPTTKNCEETRRPLQMPDRRPEPRNRITSCRRTRPKARGKPSFAQAAEAQCCRCQKAKLMCQRS